MRHVIEVGVPALIVLTMTVVGLELTVADLSRVLRYPMHITVALLGQALALPAVAAALIYLLDLEPVIAGGLILAATAPQAISSNFYCLLGRADVALSVTLTAVSSALAVIFTPLLAGMLFSLLLERRAGVILPPGKVVQQVVTGLLLPVSAGMLVRHYAAPFVERNRVRLRSFSIAAVLAVLAILLFDQAAVIERDGKLITLAAVLFTLAASALGLGLARALSWKRTEAIAMFAAFPSRSMSIVTLIAVNVLGRTEFVSFAVIFFMVQTALLVPAMLLLRGPAPNR